MKIIDVSAPEGYEVAETTAAKDIAMDIVQDVIEHCFWLCGEDDDDYWERMDEHDAISAADKIVESLIKAGWRPTEGEDDAV